jgi:putative sterol carrier protein
VSRPQIDPADVDPKVLVEGISQATDEQIAQLMEGPLRDEVLDGIFAGMAEHAREDRIRDVDAVIRWEITGRPDGGLDSWQTVLRNGSCKVTRDGDEPPRATMRVGAVDFLKLVTGNASGPMLFTFGKLKIDGDLMFAARVAGMFRIPEA